MIQFSDKILLFFHLLTKISGKIHIAIRCLKASDDLSGLLLIYSSLGLKNEMRELAEKSLEMSKYNIAF